MCNSMAVYSWCLKYCPSVMNICDFLKPMCVCRKRKDTGPQGLLLFTINRYVGVCAFFTIKQIHTTYLLTYLFLFFNFSLVNNAFPASCKAIPVLLSSDRCQWLSHSAAMPENRYLLWDATQVSMLSSPHHCMCQW